MQLYFKGWINTCGLCIRVDAEANPHESRYKSNRTYISSFLCLTSFYFSMALDNNSKQFNTRPNLTWFVGNLMGFSRFRSDSPAKRTNSRSKPKMIVWRNLDREKYGRQRNKGLMRENAKWLVHSRRNGFERWAPKAPN